MKVYKVTALAYDDEMVVGLFKTREKAMKGLMREVGTAKIQLEETGNFYNEHVIYHCVVERPNASLNYRQYQIEEFELQ